jgi:hypothetical protein
MHLTLFGRIIFIEWRTRRRPSGIWQGGLMITIGKRRVK